MTGTGYRNYLIAWAWLFAMTLVALLAGYAPMPSALQTTLLVGVTLAKILLIGAVFMHLWSEKLHLTLLALTPIALALILFFLLVPDMMETPTRTLHLR